MNTRTELLIALIALGVGDLFIPVPILAIVLIAVVLSRPRWFLNLVETVYGYPSPPADPK